MAAISDFQLPPQHQVTTALQEGTRTCPPSGASSRVGRQSVSDLSLVDDAGAAHAGQLLIVIGRFSAASWPTHALFARAAAADMLHSPPFRRNSPPPAIGRFGLTLDACNLVACKHTALYAC